MLIFHIKPYTLLLASQDVYANQRPLFAFAPVSGLRMSMLCVNREYCRVLIVRLLSCLST